MKKLFILAIVILCYSCRDSENTSSVSLSGKVEDITDFTKFDTVGISKDSARALASQIYYEQTMVSRFNDLIDELCIEHLNPDTSDIYYRIMADLSWPNEYGGNPYAITIGKSGPLYYVQISENLFDPNNVELPDNDSLKWVIQNWQRNFPISKNSFEDFEKCINSENYYNVKSYDWMAFLKIYDSNKYLFEFNDGKKHKKIYRERSFEIVGKLLWCFYRASDYNDQAIEDYGKYFGN